MLRIFLTPSKPVKQIMSKTFIKPFGDGTFAFRYINYRMREMTNEERYEGNIRSDISTKKIPTFDSVEVVRLK